MTRRTVRWALALVIVGLVGVPVVPALARPRAAEPPADRRVVVVSVPGLRWEDVEEGPVPAIRELLDESAIANLATRVTGRLTTPGEGYATLGAGTRALAPPPYGGAAYDADALFGPGRAADEFQRQHGRPPGGDVASLGWVLLQAANEGSEFNADLGVLGQALADAGVGRGVVGNADTSDPLLDDEAPAREVALGLADADGVVPCGSVGPELLEPDPGSPFGDRLSVGSVLAELDRCSTPGSVVLVEASDLRRATAAAPRTEPERRETVRAEVLARTDRLVDAVAGGLDPERDALVIVAPTTGDSRGLAVLGIRARELPAGLLISGNTRRAGYVLLTDLAPTIARLAGVELDEAEIEGRAVEARSGHGDGPHRRQTLRTGEESAVFRDRVLDPAVLILVIAVGALALAAAAAFAWGVDRAAPWLERASLVVLAYPVLTYLAALFPFHEWGAGAYWAFLLGGSALVGGLLSLARRWLLGPVLAAHGLVVAVVSVSVVALGSKLQASTVFGDSPIVAGRFTGINNVTFAFFLLAGILVACAVTDLLPGPQGRRVVVGLLAGLLIIDVAPMWGADVGGALAGLPALAVVAVRLGRWEVRWRTLVLVGLATVGLVVALGLLDLTRDSADRSHLGRLFERIGADGSSGLSTVVERKLSANLRSLTESTWRFVFLPVAMAVALVAWKARDRARALARAVPALVAALPGIGVAAVLGYGLNDSGVAVPAAMVTSLVPTVVYLSCRAARHGTVPEPEAGS